MSSARCKKKVRSLLARQESLIGELLESPPMLKGSFAQVHTRCGKPTCWCAEAKQGHPHTRITWSQQGSFTTRKVPASEIARVKRLTASYRKFRKTRRGLVKNSSDLRLALIAFEALLVADTKKSLPFLFSASKPPTPSTRRPKSRMRSQRTKSQRASQ